MRPIATDDPLAWYVGQYATRLRCQKAVDLIEVLFGVETLEDPSHVVLDGVSVPLR